MTVFAAFFLILIAAVVAPRRLRRMPAAVAAAAIFVWGWAPFTAYFARTLEGRYPIRPEPAGDAQAIVVLGGSIYPPDPSQPEILPGYNTYVRCRYAAMLYRRWKPAPVVASGGLIVDRGKGWDVSDVMRHVLETEGVPVSMIWTENQSANTKENAARSAVLLRAKGVRRIALVTEAIHMPRAVRAFEREGLDVVPAPCASRAERFQRTWQEYAIPRPENMVVNQQTLHEWLGLAWYAATARF
jgi:uncharacterized SAM-binding protein YcdF (DUF218 family)